MKSNFVILILSVSLLVSCGPASPVSETGPESRNSSPTGANDQEKDKTRKIKKGMKLEVATFGAGCFWCVEAVFKELKGVESVESGYCNGSVPNPTYRQVCTGLTGHAEVIRIHFDPKVIRFEELLEVFWKTHDPTTLNRQGADQGTQYRSGVYYHSDEQKKAAEELKKELDSAKIWSDPIVTEIVKAEKFYKAEDYHQDYFELNGEQGYCQAVIVPKLEKFRKVFKDKLKK